MLRTVSGLEGSRVVPHISVTVGVLLATASIGVLIYFIHHVATSIQADHIIAAVSRDLDDVTDRLFPDPISVGHGGCGGTARAAVLGVAPLRRQTTEGKPCTS